MEQNTTPEQNSKLQQDKKNQKAMEILLPVNRSAWAIACGYLAFFSIIPLINVVFLPATVLTGILGLYDLAKNPTKKGRGRIIFGFAMSTIGFLGWVFYYTSR